MKTDKDAGDMRGVTVNKFAEGKTYQLFLDACSSANVRFVVGYMLVNVSAFTYR